MSYEIIIFIGIVLIILQVGIVLTNYRDSKIILDLLERITILENNAYSSEQIEEQLKSVREKK
jgi:hypothetical protein